MTGSNRKVSIGSLWLILLLACAARGQAEDAPAPVDAVPPGVDVQTRGPVHEAYAAPSQARPVPTPLVTKEPPPPVDEIPPNQKPADEDVVWIPGYWAWDADRSAFTRVSGCWRVPPPGRQWLPGSWQEVEGGWHWIPGYWAVPGQPQSEYLPAPPPSLETGPSIPEPDAASDYIPGTWIFYEGRYRWRPGFWLAHRPDWIWIPAHYVWTTVGYVFVEGYWDRPLLERGLLFAPVVFAPSDGAAAPASYTPSYVITPDFLLGALFVQPADCQYYFGDYFDAGYARRGFIPWVDYRPNRWSYDPNFTWYRREFARDPGWERGLRTLYSERIAGTLPRPPRTLAGQIDLIRDLSGRGITEAAIAKTLNFTNIQNARVVVPLTRLGNVRVTGLASLALPPGEHRVEERRDITRVLHTTAVAREERERFHRDAVATREIEHRRAEGEARLLREGGFEHNPARVLHIDHPGIAPVRPPAERTEPRPVGRPAPHPIEKAPIREAPPRRAPPPPPPLPKHEERPIPHHEPPKAPKPPPPHAPSPHREEPKKK